MDRLELRLVVNEKDVLKIEGIIGRDAAGVPFSVSKIKYTLGEVGGLLRDQNCDLADIYAEADVLGKKMGGGYEVCIKLIHIEDKKGAQD